MISDLTDSQIVIECDPNIAINDNHINNGINGIAVKEEVIDENQLDINYEPNILQMEELLIQNQKLRNGLHFNNNELNHKLMDEMNHKLSKNEIWKVNHHLSNLNLFKKDCHQLLSFSEIDRSQFNEMQNKMKESIHKMEGLESLTHSAIGSQNELKLIEKLSRNGVKRSQRSHESNDLNEEITRIEKQIAVLDVFMFENKSMNQLLSIEKSLKTQIEKVMNQKIQLEKEVINVEI